MTELRFTYEDTTTEDVDLSLLAESEELTELKEDSFEDAALGAPFVPILNPELAYLATTSKISFQDIPKYASVNSITDGFQTIKFSSSMQKLPQNGINNWGVPPFTEDDKPETLISGFFAFTMNWELSRPSKIFGFELMPNLFGTFTYRVDFYEREKLAKTIIRTIIVPGPPLGPSTHGARLFAAITDGPGFDRVVITSLSGITAGFLVAQVRYQGCVTLCNPVIRDVVTKEATIPVKCCIDIPGYEVISVSNDIKARIISTSCDIHEDFVCPKYGPVTGVKTADAKIFAELQIPVTIRANGCTPIILPFTCVEAVVFTIDNAFVSTEIKNCEVARIIDVVGSDFKVAPAPPCLPHCCVEGYATISADISACVMVKSIKVMKCP